MIRTFLAVELDDVLRNQIARTQQSLIQRLGHELSKDIRIAWVQPRSIHFTITFLGDTDEGVIEPMKQGVEQAIVGHGPIQMPIERLGAFPRLHQPRVLWVGPSVQWEQGGDATRLTALHHALEDCCGRFGFASEGRPLTPHLTIARIKDGERRVGQILAHSGVLDHPLLSLGSMTIESVALMKSELRQTGPVYTKLWEVKWSRHD